MSRVTIKAIDASHPFITGDFKALRKLPGIPATAIETLKKWRVGGADRGVVAVCRGQVVGFCRLVEIRKRKRNRLIEVSFAGTWVARSARGRGVAKRMWRAALKSVRPGMVVSVVTVSDNGRRLVAALVREHPHFRWDVM